MTLRVDAELLDPPATRGDPSPVRVTLLNEGEQPVTVNGRLAPGYADSLSREVFAQLTTGDGAQTEHGLLKYERPWPTEHDLVTLASGESVSTEFDLFRWYRPRHPGSYRAVIVYDDGEHEQRSAPLELEVA